VVNSTPRPLYRRERDAVPILQEAGWAPGPVWTAAENLAPTGVRSPDRPTRNESLYRLSYSWFNSRCCPNGFRENLRKIKNSSCQSSPVSVCRFKFYTFLNTKLLRTILLRSVLWVSNMQQLLILYRVVLKGKQQTWTIISFVMLTLINPCICSCGIQRLSGHPGNSSFCFMGINKKCEACYVPRFWIVVCDVVIEVKQKHLEGQFQLQTLI
jgi:hypothetical protein